MQYASAEVKSNRELVLVAVFQDGGALRFAADDLKTDHILVLVAVTQIGRALEHAGVARTKRGKFQGVTLSLPFAVPR